MSILRRSCSYFLKRPRQSTEFVWAAVRRSFLCSSVEGFEQTESVVVVVEAELRHHATAAAATRSTLGRHVLMIGDLGWGRGSIKARSHHPPYK